MASKSRAGIAEERCRAGGQMDLEQQLYALRAVAAEARNAAEFMSRLQDGKGGW